MLLQVFIANEMLVANKVSGVKGGDKLIKKCGKSSKFQKLAKSGKKLSKSGNSSNFDTKKNGPSFLTPNTRMAFNCLRLAFTKAPILWHFDSECHIWIETNTSNYAIGGMLS